MVERLPEGMMPDNVIAIDLGPARDVLRSIYDDYRDALLNRLYNGIRVEQYSSRTKSFDIVIALGASGSGVAGFALWQAEYGKLIWGLISAVSIILAVIKPILKWPEKLDEYSELYAEYSLIYGKFKQIVDSINFDRVNISTTGSITPAISGAVKEAREKILAVTSKGDKRPNKSLVKKLVDDVNSSIPAYTLWLPD
jgi:hypothetical protein